MRRIFYVAIAIMAFVTTAQSQVTIGSGLPPSRGALLDLKEDANGTSTKGLFLPRVALDSTNSVEPLTGIPMDSLNGMIVYNTHTSPITVPDSLKVFPGLYYNSGTHWVRSSAGQQQVLPKSMMPEWFYMPSFVIDISKPATDVMTIDLFNEVYLKEFSTPYISSGYGEANEAPVSIPHATNATDLYYYITYYPTNLLDILSLTQDGILTYRSTAEDVTDAAYVNVIAVLKGDN